MPRTWRSSSTFSNWSATSPAAGGATSFPATGDQLGRVHRPSPRAGYNGVLSIEHEDSAFGVEEGFLKGGGISRSTCSAVVLHAYSVIPILLTVAIGYLLERRRAAEVGVLATIAIYVLLPALIFDNLLHTTLTVRSARPWSRLTCCCCSPCGCWRRSSLPRAATTIVRKAT